MHSEEFVKGAIVIIDSVLGLVGNTRVARLDTADGAEVFVKLEGDNPSGSILDRLLTSAIFAGGSVEVRQHDQLAAAIAHMTTSLGLPLTLLTDSPTSNSARMATAFGATVEHSTERDPMYMGVELEPDKALASLVEECEHVRGPDRSLVVVVPPVFPFAGSFLGTPAGASGTVEYVQGSVCVPLVRADRAARQRLARRGLLMDDLSATCVEWAEEYSARRPHTTVIAIAACDGAITPHWNAAIVAGGEL
jgi:hypothetical protein